MAAPYLLTDLLNCTRAGACARRAAAAERASRPVGFRAASAVKAAHLGRVLDAGDRGPRAGDRIPCAEGSGGPVRRAHRVGRGWLVRATRQTGGATKATGGRGGGGGGGGGGGACPVIFGNEAASAASLDVPPWQCASASYPSRTRCLIHAASGAGCSMHTGGATQPRSCPTCSSTYGGTWECRRPSPK